MYAWRLMQTFAETATKTFGEHIQTAVATYSETYSAKVVDTYTSACD